MSACIFIEGGGDSKELRTRCREGFSKLLVKYGFDGKMPRLIACGGRDAVYDKFKTELARNDSNDYVAMWIDSEEPLEDVELAWEHLRKVTTVTPWDKPAGADDDQVLFMTTCMETWIVADRNTLKEHYGSKLQKSALPPVLPELERRTRDEVQDKLEHATRNCSNAYRKGKRSFEVLSKLMPDNLKNSLPSFARVCRILEEQL
ncbi:MAG: DUF4276 family protein [Vulcanimicrobiota bacterium]